MLPQIFLSGVFTPIGNLPMVLDILSRMSPMRYAVDLARGIYYAGKPEHPFTLTPWGIFSRSLGMFTQTFFHFNGYKDGIPGFIVAGFQFLAYFMLMIKLWERESGNNDKISD